MKYDSILLGIVVAFLHWEKCACAQSLEGFINYVVEMHISTHIQDKNGTWIISKAGALHPCSWKSYLSGSWIVCGKERNIGCDISGQEKVFILVEGEDLWVVWREEVFYGLSVCGWSCVGGNEGVGPFWILEYVLCYLSLKVKVKSWKIDSTSLSRDRRACQSKQISFSKSDLIVNSSSC